MTEGVAATEVVEPAEPAKTRKLAQPGTTMFERNIARACAADHELMVITQGGVEYFGYASGLDEMCLQLCLTEDATQVLINLQSIESVEDAGVKSPLPEKWRTIEERIGVFRSVAKMHVKKAK